MWFVGRWGKIFRHYRFGPLARSSSELSYEIINAIGDVHDILTAHSLAQSFYRDREPKT
jgi:hypothetical protein